MLAERGVPVDHATIRRWMQRDAPEIEKRLRWNRKHAGLRQMWKIDETCVKVKGRRACLCRAVTGNGRTIDFCLSRTRGAQAARRFPGKALRPFTDWEKPTTINADKAGCHGQVLCERKREGTLSADTRHKPVR